MGLELFVKQLHDDAVLPHRSSILNAGLDCHALGGYKLDPGERKVIKTGYAVSVPPGFYGRLATRPEVGLKHGIDVIGGIINPGDHSEVTVTLINHGVHKFIIAPGDVIAHLIIEAILTPEIVKVDDLDDTPNV